MSIVFKTKSARVALLAAAAVTAGTHVAEAAFTPACDPFPTTVIRTVTGLVQTNQYGESNLVTQVALPNDEMYGFRTSQGTAVYVDYATQWGTEVARTCRISYNGLTWSCGDPTSHTLTCTGCMDELSPDASAITAITNGVWDYYMVEQWGTGKYTGTSQSNRGIGVLLGIGDDYRVAFNNSLNGATCVARCW